MALPNWHIRLTTIDTWGPFFSQCDPFMLWQALLHNHLFSHVGGDACSPRSTGCRPEVGELKAWVTALLSQQPQEASAWLPLSARVLLFHIQFPVNVSQKTERLCLSDECTHSSILLGITSRKSRLIPDQNCQCNPLNVDTITMSTTALFKD